MNWRAKSGSSHSDACKFFSAYLIAYNICIFSRWSLWLTCKMHSIGLLVRSAWLSGSIGSNPWTVCLFSTHFFWNYLAQDQELTATRFYLLQCPWDKDTLSVRWFQELATYRNMETKDCMSSCAGIYMHTETVICPCLWMLKLPYQG